MNPKRLNRMRAIVKRIPWLLEHELRSRLGFVETEETLVAESQVFWNGPLSNRLKRYSHWRGVGANDDSHWRAMGDEHLEMFRQFCAVVGLECPVEGIVDWGCGGGANAVRFAGEAKSYHGVDISQANLEECGRQLSEIGYRKFEPILINANCPEAIFDRLEKGSCDFFLCTHVFDLLPSPEYGIRLLKVARDLIRMGGGAMVHFRYRDGRRYFEPKRWGYARNVVSMTAYNLDDFWKSTEECGLRPLFLRLRPTDPHIGGSNYAYIFLTK